MRLMQLHRPWYLPAKLALALGVTLLASASIIGCSGDSKTVTAPPPTPTAPSITTQPVAQTAFVGATATFSVTAGGTAPLSYQWLKGGTAVSGATSASYTTPALALADNGASYTVTVSNTAGKVTSAAATLTVSYQLPAITAQPSPVTVTVGSSASFAVTATGSAPLTYQWSRGGTPIAGATSATYSIAKTLITDDGSLFSVTVTNPGGTVTSNTAKLTVDPAPVTITSNPGDTTRFVGETATFNVTASGTNPTYQWRKNAAAISGATSPTYTTPTLAATDDKSIYDVVVENAAGSVTSTGATLRMAPIATTYKDINGATLNLFAWPGTKNAIQSKSSTIPGADMRRFTNLTDQIYGYYQKAVGLEPALFINFNGLATISQVPSTCGAGCTYIGATGMEFLDPYFDSIQQEAAEGYVDQALAYEFGRSFWLMGRQLEYVTPDNSSCIVTGYAVLMRYEAIEGLGLKGYSDSPDGYKQALAATRGLVDEYAADTSLNWANTTKVDNFTIHPGLGCSDLFASQMMRLGDTYGGQQKFINALWKESLKRPVKVVTQDAVDNLILAACAAANHNLTNTFVNDWRWPMSTAAQNEATSKYGAP